MTRAPPGAAHALARSCALIAAAWTAAYAPIAAAADDADDDPTTTTVTAARPVEIDDASARTEDSAALASGNPEDVLAEAGASLVHDGGPLSPARPMVRGLSGARLAVDVDGLALADPATGLVDAAGLPWSAASRVVVDSGAGAAGEAGALHLALARRPGVRARLLAGSLSTVRGSLAASDGDLLVAVDGGVTRGDFAYHPASSVAGTDPVDVVRANNDQRRASAVAAWRSKDDDAVHVDAVAFAAGHSGGIAGMAASPTHGLRGEDALAGAHVATRAPLSAASGARLTVDAGGRAAHRATFGPDDPRSAIDSAGGDACVGVAGVPVGAARVDVGAFVDGAALLGAGAGADAAGFSRIGGGARVSARAPLGSLARLRVALDGRAQSDVGPLFSGELRAEIGGDGPLRASLGVARASRAPTLDELYAPRGLVLGNPALGPEAVDDAELAVALAPSRIVTARAVAFAGYIEDAIAYVNKSAFAVAPENVGPGVRGGIDISTTVEPSSWFALTVVGEALASRLAATGAPLPAAPPFHALLAARLGAAAGPSATAALRARGATPSNAFGTLEAAPYALLDLSARLPVGDTLALGAALTNALDVKDARDQNQLPLPGRLFFVSLEVHG